MHLFLTLIFFNLLLKLNLKFPIHEFISNLPSFVPKYRLYKFPDLNFIFIGIGYNTFKTFFLIKRNWLSLMNYLDHATSIGAIIFDQSLNFPNVETALLWKLFAFFVHWKDLNNSSAKTHGVLVDILFFFNWYWLLWTRFLF